MPNSEEIIHIIQRMAPGRDEIGIELIKNGGDELYERICGLVHKSMDWRDDASKLEKKRPGAV